MYVYNHDQRKEVVEAARNYINDYLQWAVGYSVPASEYDDHKEHYSFIALFNDPFDAQEYIDSRQNPDKLFITRIPKEK